MAAAAVVATVTDGFEALEARRLEELTALGLSEDEARSIALDEWHSLSSGGTPATSSTAAAPSAALVGAPPARAASPGSADVLMEDAASSGERPAQAAETEPESEPLAAVVKREQVDDRPQPKAASGTRQRAKRSSAAATAGGAGAGGKRAKLEPKLEAKKEEEAKVPAGSLRAKSEPAAALGKGDWLSMDELFTAPASRSAGGADEEAEAEPGSGAPGAQDEAEARLAAFRRSPLVHLGEPHPEWLTEPVAIARIALPKIGGAGGAPPLRIPRAAVQKGLLSSPQLETVAYAVRRFRTRLPDGSKAGYYLGDGTGCGKGRVIAACCWHLWNEGSRRHLWLSASADLLEDARRDLRDIGANLPLASLGSMPYGAIAGRGGGSRSSSSLDGLDSKGDGVLFASYNLLVASKQGAKGNLAKATPENSRLAQVIEWLGGHDASGLVVFDEAHKAKNTGGADWVGASKTGQAVVQLQQSCKGLACMYASATGATEIKHLGYMDRLGLHGLGRPHKDFEELKAAVEKGGLAAMELIAITMRSEGMLSCRALSFRGTSFNLRIMDLAPAQVVIYTAAAELWQHLYKVLGELQNEEKKWIRANYGKRNVSKHIDMSTTMRYFWGMQQQFFKQLLVSMKVDRAVQMVNDALIRGEQVVVSMWSTGEAQTEAGLQKLPSGSSIGSTSTTRTGDEVPRSASNGSLTELSGFVCGLEVMVERLLERIFVPLARSREQISAVEGLRAEMRAAELPAGLLDLILQRLGGPSKVAELSGRTRRLISTAGGMHLEDRVANGEPGSSVNVAEQRAFQEGRKKVAIVTEAASAGISLHSERREGASAAPRYMLTLELPWEADKAVQQLGRVHRSNQVHPPRFGLLLTQLGGECRFASSVARRMRLLGAITRGDRAAAADVTGGLEGFDVQNRYGKRALDRFYELLRTHADFPTSLSFVGWRKRWRDWNAFYKEAEVSLAKVGIKLNTDEKWDESLKESKTLNAFLNRILMLDPETQNALFEAVHALYGREVQVDQEAGLYDEGLETLNAKYGQRLVIDLLSREVVFTDPESGAETTYIRLKLDRGMPWEAAQKLFDSRCDEIRGDGFYLWRREGREATPALAVACPRSGGSRHDDDDEDEDKRLFILYTPAEGALAKLPGSSTRLTREALVDHGSLRATTGSADLPRLSAMWKAQYEFGAEMPAGTPESRYIEEHVLGGSILNVWGVIASAVTGGGGGGPRSGAASYGAPERLPLIRARARNVPAAIVGVRVDPDRLNEVRYALQVLKESAQVVQATRTSSSSSSRAAPRPKVEAKVPPPSYEVVKSSMEKHLESLPGKCDPSWKGWAQVHAYFVEKGIADNAAECVVAVQHWVGELLRLRIMEEADDAGGIRIREQPKGCGWYVPPPKPKPLPKRGGRGRGRGGGRGGGPGG